MKAKEFIPATKPRNFVAKNQKTAGAGAHRDKKRDEKQGNVKHKRDLMPMEAGWKDEAEDVGEWTDYVKERLTKASPEQRLSLAKKLSQVEVKNFGSSLGGGFDRNTGKAKTGELTDTVRSALRSISAGRSSDGDGPAGNFSMPFGSVDIQGMENATPEELAVMKKAVMMGPQVAGAAAKLYKKNGTITSQDLKSIESDFEKASGIEFGKPMYSSPEAKIGKEKAIRDEGMTEGSAHGYNVTRFYKKYRDQSKITRWLKKEAGLPKETKLYFDDADLVLGSDTIVPYALVDERLKFNDLLTALVKVAGGTSKEKVDGVYRDQGVAEGEPMRSPRPEFIDTIMDKYKDSLPGQQKPGKSAVVDYTPKVGDEVLWRHSDPMSKMMPMPGTVLAVAPGKVKLKIYSKRMIQDRGTDTVVLGLDNYKITPKKDVAEGLNELSSDLLGRYKKAAGDQATAADKAGDYDKGNKRFKGIVKATNKQFDNDAKKRK